MRHKTILLGLILSGITFILMSGRPFPTEADKGLNPGERIPSIMVDGKDLSTDISENSEAILVVWSTDDAISRVVNSWISNNQSRGANVPVYSICMDAEQQDAEYYAHIDNVNLKSATLFGVKSESRVMNGFREFASIGGVAKVYHTTYGMIQRVETTSSLWGKIQKEMAI